MTNRPFHKNFYLTNLHAGNFQDAADLEIHSGEKLWNIEDIEEQLKNPRNFGWFVTNAKQPVAYMLFHSSARREWHDSPYAHQNLEIINLVVDPDFRRQRIGSVLLNKLENWKGIRKHSISAVVSETNGFAHQFFRNNGYRATLENQKFYRFERILKKSVETVECIR